MTQTIPVLIAGGGPAGIAVATVLASRGLACMIVEPAAVVQPKAGETIPPNARPLFSKLGIESMLHAPVHLPCHGNRFVWGGAGERNFFTAASQHGWHLNRLHFEAQLRAHSEQLGVQWLPGWRVMHCKAMNEGWEVIVQDVDSNPQTIRCNFLVDATGRASRIARLLGHQRTRLDALTGLWCIVDTTEQVKPYCTFIEATPCGWWYAAPLHNKKLSLAFMTDSDLVGGEYLELAQNTDLIKPLLEKTVSAEQLRPAVHPASTSHLDVRYGQHWLAVGDAAYAYDPISSYGIVSALESGFLAGHAIADHTAGNADALPAYDFLTTTMFNTYLRMHKEQYAQENRWPGEAFWRRRRM